MVRQCSNESYFLTFRITTATPAISWILSGLNRMNGVDLHGLSENSVCQKLSRRGKVLCCYLVKTLSAKRRTVKPTTTSCPMNKDLYLKPSMILARAFFIMVAGIQLLKMFTCNLFEIKSYLGNFDQDFRQDDTSHGWHAALTMHLCKVFSVKVGYCSQKWYKAKYYGCNCHVLMSSDCFVGLQVICARRTCSNLGKWLRIWSTALMTTSRKCLYPIAWYEACCRHLVSSVALTSLSLSLSLVVRMFYRQF